MKRLIARRPGGSRGLSALPGKMRNMGEVDEGALAAAAARQQGLVTHRQAVAAGMSRTALSRRVRAARWRIVRPRVYATGAPAGIEQRLMAATLWAGTGALVSHRSAALLWGLEVPQAALDITVERGRFGKSSGIVVHRSLVIADEDRRIRRGIPVTSVARTIIDLASCVDEEALAGVVEEAWRKQLAAPDWIERRLRRLGGAGRPGARMLGMLLADCRRRGVPLESALEVRLWRALLASGLPVPEPGYPFRDSFGQPGRIDFAYPDQRLAIEADGFGFHGDREAFERDRLRMARLALGWRVLPVTWRQLDEQPTKVLERLARALKFSTQGAEEEED